MKVLGIVIVFFILNYNGFAQVDIDGIASAQQIVPKMLNNTRTSLIVNQTKGITKYTIGIGNQESKMFFDVLAKVQNTSAIKVIAVCETNSIIGIEVENSEYKSYDEVSHFLVSEFPDISLYRKEETIFNLDCKNEILKQ